MDKQNLMQILHQYTPFEEFCRDNYSEILKTPDIIDTFIDMHPDYIYQRDGLHYPIYSFIKNNDDTVTDFYTIEQISHSQTLPPTGNITNKLSSKEKILVTQHDRFSPPAMHKHNYYELFYVYEGEILHTIDINTARLHTGDICLIPPGVLHNLDVKNYSIVLNILIEKSTFHNIFLNVLKGNNILSEFFLGNIYTPNVNTHIIFHTFGDPKIQSIITDLCMETLLKEPYFNELLHIHLLLLFGYLLRNYEKSCEMPTIKARTDITDYGILKCIEENYADITLEKLSQQFHYSPQQISSRLQKLTGHNFSFLILQKRMEKAKELLLYTDMKIKDISLEIGYMNQEHFIRTFKKYYDTTPLKYRRYSH